MIKYAASLIGVYGCGIVIWLGGMALLIFFVVTVLRWLHVLPPA